MDFVIKNKNLSDFKSALDEHGFCVIKNFQNKEGIQEKLTKFKDLFSTSNDIRITGPYFYGMKNFQRIDLGDYRQTNARFSRMITQFTWDDSSFLAEEIDSLVKFRNEFCKISRSDHKYKINNEVLCDLPKLLQYPKGGGFMNMHTDDNNEYAVMNFLLSLSKRGADYQKGGAYYHNKNGKYIDVENVLDVGDLYAHLPTTLHGVHAVDPEHHIDLNTFSGRMSINLSLQKFERI